MPSREASLKNLEKARKNWRHPPRPWRSYKESCVIEQLVWQWFNSHEPRKWSGRAVACWLGVSHTYVQKLVRKFRANPDRMLRLQAGLDPATFDQLCRAREFSRKDRERGYLRPPIRWRVVEFNMARFVVPTKAEERRIATEAGGRVVGPTPVPLRDLPLWANGLPYYSPQNPCDPLAAVKYGMQQKQSVRPAHFIRRRWRASLPFR